MPAGFASLTFRSGLLSSHLAAGGSSLYRTSRWSCWKISATRFWICTLRVSSQSPSSLRCRKKRNRRPLLLPRPVNQGRRTHPLNLSQRKTPPRPAHPPRLNANMSLLKMNLKLQQSKSAPRYRGWRVPCHLFLFLNPLNARLSLPSQRLLLKPNRPRHQSWTQHRDLLPLCRMEPHPLYHTAHRPLHPPATSWACPRPVPTCLGRGFRVCSL